MEINKGDTVKTTKKLKIKDYSVDELFIRNRRNTEDSTVDSPVYLINNKLWLVRHSNSGLVRGISIGYYAVYHESELEVVDTPKPAEKDGDKYLIDY